MHARTAQPGDALSSAPSAPAAFIEPFAQPDAARHPGAARAPRIVEATSRGAREFAIALPDGANVGETLVALLDRMNAASGCARIVSGECRRLQYHTMIRADAGERPYVYGPPIVVGPATLIDATLTIGRREDGARVLHCHGGFVDPLGAQHGGHVVLERTIAGARGLRAHLCLIDDIDIVATPDDETAFSLLEPSEAA